jgi:L,D-peptidoglycan transpeptidase YkuD (ErfK/YbiS/YcfS/YnhG family)
MRWIAVAACLPLALAAATAGSSRSATASCPPSLANQLASTGAARELITVAAARRSSTQGALRLWRKPGLCWRPVAGPWTAWLGEHGTSTHKREGDLTTPAGAFGFLPTMYGLAPSPGVRYRYHRIVCGDWWVEDPGSPFYNRFKHVPCGSTPPFRVKSEDMSRSRTAYQSLAVIAYNSDPIVPGRGSGIFLHVSTGRPTLGCVSLPRSRLLAVLRWLDPRSAPLIAIGTNAEIRRF